MEDKKDFVEIAKEHHDKAIAIPPETVEDHVETGALGEYFSFHGNTYIVL